MMKPMPPIAKFTGPKEAGRHWDWKARSDSDIILPTEPKFGGREIDFVIFDEATDLKEEDWMVDFSKKYKEMWGSGEATTGTFTDEPEALTAEKLVEAKRLIETIEDNTMTRKKIPKKKRPRGDPRRANYNGRMFGNILLSTTEQIANNTTLNDALAIEGAGNTTIEELIVPLFEEFTHAQGKNWQVTGPMNLSAQSVETSKWKSVSALGGEVLHYHSVVVGKRDGICIKWTTGSIVGLDEEMMLDTTIKGFGDKLVPAQSNGNPANRATLIDILLDFAGKADIVTAAEEAKEAVRLAVAAQLKEDIDRKSEAYGESFGSWA